MELEMEDPETQIRYKVILNKDDCERAHQDVSFASSLLESIKKDSLAEVSPSRSEADEILSSEVVGISPSTSPVEKHVWQYSETLALIKSLETHFEYLSHPKKRKHVFENVANDLLSMGLICNATMCQAKWKSLVRSYTTAKDNKNKTGRGPSRFQFFNELDNILGMKPSNKCQHILESSSDQLQADEHSLENDTLNTNAEAAIQLKVTNDPIIDTQVKSNIKRKVKTNSGERLNEKKKLNEEKNKRHLERMEIERLKLEVEKQKLEMLQKYLNKERS